jgi:uncharacterized membrane protein YdfJ with MMPL/SSD domain
MTAANPTWLRRHRWVVPGFVAAAILIAGGLALASAVHNARIAATRAQDL